MTKTKRAFTLLEFVIALNVIAILALVAIPGFLDFIQKQELRNAARQLSYDLIYARSSAIESAKPVYASFYPGKTEWCYGLVDKESEISCNCKIENSCRFNDTTYLVSNKNYRHIELVGARFAGSDNIFGFEPYRGMPKVNGAARNGTIWLKNRKGLTMAVVINRIGRIRICDVGKSDCPSPP